MTLELFCYIDGKSFSEAIGLKIEGNDTVDTLKNAIKQRETEHFASVSSSRLHHWKVSIHQACNSELVSRIVKSLPDGPRVPITREFLFSRICGGKLETGSIAISVSTITVHNLTKRLQPWTSISIKHPENRAGLTETPVNDDSKTWKTTLKSVPKSFTRFSYNAVEELIGPIGVWDPGVLTP
ncbi:MAG: hypothetical protein J3Q66DRAFT_345523 [Benniella sp.]|nr:MAG: hypothetical protein J3Q66DRAFT_345523 [Benniella sp.]